MYSTLKRRKSASSQTASISAWCTVFDWPSMVAALRTSRQGPVRRSAARRKTAARSGHGVTAHARRARSAAAIALPTSAASARWMSPSTWLCRCGITEAASFPVRTSLPSMTEAISTRSAAMRSSACLSEARSGEPGRYPLTGSL